MSQPELRAGCDSVIVAELMLHRTIDETLDNDGSSGRLQNVRYGLELEIGSDKAWGRWEGEVRRAAGGGLGGTDSQEALFEGLIMSESFPSTSSLLIGGPAESP